MRAPTPSSTGPGRAQRRQRILDWEPSRHPLWLRLLVAAVLTVLAVWFRGLIAPATSGGRFVTLTLAVTISSLYGGLPTGALSAVLGILLVNFPLTQGSFHLAIPNPVEAFWLSGVHLITQFGVIVSIVWMQQKNQRLREAGEAARHAHLQYTATFEQAAAGITHVGMDGRLIRVNQRFCDMVGYTREELLHLRFQDITHPDDIADDEAQMAQAITGQLSDYTLEKRYIHRNGHIVWVKLTVALVRDGDKAPDYLISIVQDITSVKATNEALRTSERLIRQATQLAGLASWVVEVPSMRFRALFDSHRMLGLPKAEFTQAEVIALCHPDDRAHMAQKWVQGIKGEAPYILEHRMLVNGQERWILAQAEFERDETGQATRALGVTYDITTRKRSELEIQQLNTSLEARIRERTQQLQSAYSELESYSYAVAHDLRSPLRIINGFAQALKEDRPDLDETQVLYLSRIMGASRQMGLLIDGLLKLSQYARGELQREPISISDIARQQLEDLQASEPQRQVRWTVEPGLTAFADPSLVNALLQNLLDNAWKYTAARTDATIRVSGRRVGATQFYCIDDNGAGFDMGHAGKLFQPFQRMHQSGDFQGLGIGLATARRIVERHGGRITAEASPGEGATFSFSLAPAEGDAASPSD
ncbi:MAG: PAS domain S-box protein [Hydrogenophaga sp.]|uniref:PAS domain S-box protein n=2 Tax=Hydrogenophaga sp. TaxID=1904254 RepID=UPI002617AFD2|nr:PAS domain S-box protein [Hydrogenophaga sp.]MDD3785915.1 PAS domain S-box protein [Hydrogenophaga sp.]